MCCLKIILSIFANRLLANNIQQLFFVIYDKIVPENTVNQVRQFTEYRAWYRIQPLDSGIKRDHTKNKKYS